MNNDYLVTKECSMCGQETNLKLLDSEIEGLERYFSGELIQECLPSLNKVEREFIKSGYCSDCQELLFGDGSSKRLYQTH